VVLPETPEYPVSVELIVHFLLYLLPWAILGGAIGWFVDRRKKNGTGVEKCD
jgi:hypothetical protein